MMSNRSNRGPDPPDTEMDENNATPETSPPPSRSVPREVLAAAAGAAILGWVGSLVVAINPGVGAAIGIVFGSIPWAWHLYRTGRRYDARLLAISAGIVALVAMLGAKF